MLEAKPQSWWGWNFALMDGATTLATVRVGELRERARLEVAGTEYRLIREGAMSGAWVLSDAAGERARAVKPSAFRDRFVVSFDGAEYVLEARHRFAGTDMAVLEGDAQIGSLAGRGFFRRTVAVDLPQAWPLLLQALLLALATILWKRESDASAASTTSS